MTPMELLQEIRGWSPNEPQTTGLPDAVVRRFLERDPSLGQAIAEAHEAHVGLREAWGDYLRGDEGELVTWLQSDYVNFYPAQHVNPYVALAARGPWLVTAHGAVLHDSGGYGMLGMGHGPEVLLQAMGRPWVMANVMTAAFSQKRFADRLRAEVGQRRGYCPYHQFICMNSGSEAVTVAMRIADIQARTFTAAGGRYEGWETRLMCIKGAFHGRTDRPAQVSDSTLPKYRQHLRSFQGRDNLVVIPPNDVEALRRAFEQADADKVFIEAMFFEPVMGEGNPGQAVSRAFYDAARELTRERGTMLVADSIQAGLRGTGYLSIVDYPGFEDADPPDMETWSKALNGGQYPLSVLACARKAADTYVRGVYGNTMTTNPRALEVGVAVLEELTPELRVNIRERGKELVAKLRALAEEFPGVITRVEGTGLLLAAHIHPERAKVEGFDGLEAWCRRNGIGVIHGGTNALRFTPHFAITSDEVDLLVDVVRSAIRSVADLETVRVSAEARERAT